MFNKDVVVFSEEYIDTYNRKKKEFTQSLKQDKERYEKLLLDDVNDFIENVEQSIESSKGKYYVLIRHGLKSKELETYDRLFEQAIDIGIKSEVFVEQQGEEKNPKITAITNANGILLEGCDLTITSHKLKHCLADRPGQKPTLTT